MYRILKSQCSLQNVYFSSKRTTSRHSLELCPCYKNSHVFLVIKYLQPCRYITTINNIELNVPHKIKAKQKSRKFAELLEVTSEATNKKAAIKKLNAAHLCLMVDQPANIKKKSRFNKKNINSPPASTMLKESESYSNDHELILDDLKHSDVNDQTMLVQNSIILNELEKTNESVESNDDEKKKKGKRKEEEKKKKLTTQVNKQKKSDIENSLMWLTHMDAYIYSNMLNRAHKLFTIYKRKKSSSSDTYINLYNLLLDAYGSKGYFDKFFELYKLIDTNSIIPTAQTYVILLDTVGKLHQNENQLETVRKIVQNMTKRDISLHDLFNNSKFRKDQRENVLRVIRLIESQFTPTYNIPDVDYNCKLMNSISEGNTRNNHVKDLLSLNELYAKLSKQIDVENKMFTTVKSIELQDTNNETFNFSKRKISEFEEHWEEVATLAFKRNLKYLILNENCTPSPFILHPFLQVLERKQYINIIMEEIQKLTKMSEFFSISKNLLCINLGRLIFRKFKLQKDTQNGVLDKTVDIYKGYLKWYLDDKSYSIPKNSRIAWQLLEHKAQQSGASLDLKCIPWYNNIYMQIGQFLYNIILNDIKIDINALKESKSKFSIPAFYTLFRAEGRRMIEQIKPHPVIVKLYNESKLNLLTFNSETLPTLNPPRPWISINSGGYVCTKTTFVRCPLHMTYPLKKLEAISSNQLYPVMDSLNQLGSVPWKINTRMLDIIIQIFQNGGSESLNVPQSPSVLEPAPLLNVNATAAERLLVAKARKKFIRKKMEMYSLWCDCLYRLSLANHYRDQIFWLPHNMDFRGRVYPLSPNLTHLGSDLMRSILLFAQGKPLGARGLDWLKIHTINLTGLKKRDSISERLKYANDNLDKILDSAEKPFTGDMWWKTADEPWQTLAACTEIATALKSPNVEEYVCNFPIHQDGSCNGLQHYAALGRDEIGAKSVNLYPAERPQDVYSTVASMVEQQRETDEKNGIEIAKVLNGFIKRKVIKQTVMTTVYGVTKFGARLQISKQLKDLNDFPEEHIWQASLYLVHNTFNSLRTMFTSAKHIQDWFIECASVISSKHEKNIEWLTPLKLPVIQPYVKFTKLTEKPDSMKQRNAFAPNFVHSLDSSHMMLTSLHCDQEGITFMSVHDCYWTHPSTVDLMNKICRAQFVALHSEPILEDLSKFFMDTYVLKESASHSSSHSKKLKNYNQCFSKVPEQGDFDLKKVLSSTYFFS